MTTEETRLHNLALDDVELKELAKVLDQCISESRVEKHHTDSAHYRELVAAEVECLENLLQKVRRLVEQDCCN